MLAKPWALIKETVSGFMAHDALSRAAAIAYFTIFSLAPLLLIVIGIAGLVFGHEAAQRAILGQLGGMMGKQSGDALLSMMQSAGTQGSGTWATLIGVVTLLITASGAFSQIQSSLNTIWDAEPKAGLSRLVRARVASLGLVLTLGFLMLVSLVISAGLAALGNYLNALFPAAHAMMAVANFVITLALLSAVFAAIFKFLPDKEIAWRDVAIGAVATSLLFTIGKSLIGLYIGQTHVATSYGAAGSLIVILMWIYYSSLIFLLGAEFTRAYTEMQGSHAGQAKPAERAEARPARAAAQPEAEREPPPGAPLPANLLETQTALTRNRMSETMAIIRAQIPPTPTWRDPGGQRPSWLQVAVATLAVFTLPPRREPPKPEPIPEPQPPIVHRRIGPLPPSAATEPRRERERAPLT